MKNFSIGVLLDGLKLPFEDSLKTVADMGIQGVQIYAVNGDMAPENLNPAKISEKKEMLAHYGIEVSALCGDFGGSGFTDLKENPLRIERSKRIIDLALELGSNIVTTHIGVIPEDDKSNKFLVMQDACNQLAEYAHSHGAFFAIETGPEKALRLRTFLDSLDSKGVAVNMDPANFVMVTGQDPVEAVYLLEDYIVHTHAKDGIRLVGLDPNSKYASYANSIVGDNPPEWGFIEVPLGRGQVDFPNYIAALRNVGFNGYLTIEREVGDNPIGDIRMAISYLKEIIG